MAASLPRQDHVSITTEQLVRFHKNKFDQRLCKLDSSEFARSFKQNPTLPEFQRFFSHHHLHSPAKK